MVHDVEPVELRSRCAPDLHQKIKAAADEAVRSMSAEIAYRLQKSFQQDETKHFVFDKEFFFLYNKDMDPAIVAQIDKALTEIFAEGKIQETQKKSFFIPDFKPSAEAEAYLKDKAAQIDKVLKSIK